MTKWVLLGAGAVLAVWGLYWGLTGWSIVEVERGWSAVVSGAAVFSAGAIISALGALCWQIEQFIKAAAISPAGRAGETFHSQQAGPSVVVVTAPGHSSPAAAATAATATVAAAMAAVPATAAAAAPPAPAPAALPSALLEPEPDMPASEVQPASPEAAPLAPPDKAEHEKPEEAGPAPAPGPSQPQGAEQDKPWLKNPGQAFVKSAPDAEPDAPVTNAIKPEPDPDPARAAPAPHSPRVIIPPPRGPVQFRVIEGAQAQESQSNAPAANASETVAETRPPGAPADVPATPVNPDQKPAPQIIPPPAAKPAESSPEPKPVEPSVQTPRRPMPPLAPLTMNAPWPAAPAGSANLLPAASMESDKAAPAAPASLPPPAPEPSSALDKLMAEFDALPQQIETAAISPADVKDIAVTAPQAPPAQIPPAQEPAILEPAHEDAAPAAPRALVREYESQGIRYFLYADGSVDAHAPSGVYQFASLEELRIYIESRGAR